MKKLMLGGLLAVAVYGLAGTYYVHGTHVPVMSSEVPSEIVRYVLSGLGLIAPWVLARVSPTFLRGLLQVCEWTSEKIRAHLKLDPAPTPAPAPQPKPLDVIKDAFSDTVEGLISELIRRLFKQKATVSQIDKAVELAKDLCCTPTHSVVLTSAHVTGNSETKP